MKRTRTRTMRGTSFSSSPSPLSFGRQGLSLPWGIRPISVFEREQVDALIAALPDYLQDLTRFTYLCGWRKSEVVGLTWPMVNMAAETITIPTSKSGRPRTLDLDGEVLA